MPIERDGQATQVQNGTETQAKFVPVGIPMCDAAMLDTIKNLESGRPKRMLTTLGWVSSIFLPFSAAESPCTRFLLLTNRMMSKIVAERSAIILKTEGLSDICPLLCIYWRGI